MVKFTSSVLKQWLLFCAPVAHGALTVDIENPDSVKAAATIIAEDLVSFYHGDEPGATIGLLSEAPPSGQYYWWTGGAFWGTLIDLRSRTANTTYDDIIVQGLQAQVGQKNDFMPANYTASMGNDDQAFWGHAAMLASETGFKNPASGDLQWLTLAQNVFDDQTARRLPDGGSCPGVLRWQIPSFATGYDYVQTAANAFYFSLGAQLAYVGKNQTSADLASKTYDSLSSLGFITDDFSVYEGAHFTDDCTDINKLQLSYSPAALLQGSAYMYNMTAGSEIWKTRIDGLLDHTLELFFPNGIASEIACEPTKCTTDMQFFKGFLHRWLASTMKLAPYTADRILPILKTSAVAAVAQCSGGDNGRMCGLTWTGRFDNITGAGPQSSVLGALISVMSDNGNISSDSTGSGTAGNGSGTAGNGSGTAGNGSDTGNGGGAGTNSTTGSTKGNMGAGISISVSALLSSFLLSVLWT